MTLLLQPLKEIPFEFLILPILFLGVAILFNKQANKKKGVFKYLVLISAFILGVSSFIVSYLLIVPFIRFAIIIGVINLASIHFLIKGVKVYENLRERISFPKVYLLVIPISFFSLFHFVSFQGKTHVVLKGMPSFAYTFIDSVDIDLIRRRQDVGRIIGNESILTTLRELGLHAPSKEEFSLCIFPTCIDTSAAELLELAKNKTEFMTDLYEGTKVKVTGEVQEIGFVNKGSKNQIMIIKLRGNEEQPVYCYFHNSPKLQEGQKTIIIGALKTNVKGEIALNYCSLFE